MIFETYLFTFNNQPNQENQIGDLVGGLIIVGVKLDRFVRRINKTIMNDLIVSFEQYYLLVCFITKLHIILDMVEGIGFPDKLSLAQTIGIVGTMVLTLYFSKRQIQSLSVDQQTRVINDLDEKVRKMAEIIIEKPSMQKVIYKLEEPSEELAFAYYILWICSHVFSMRQRKVLNDNEWEGWLHWMKNCFRYGSIAEQWNLIRSER